MTHMPAIDGPVEPTQPWSVSVVDETGSTNDDLLRVAEQGALADRSVLRADHQTTGRGRLDRRWDAPSGSNLLASLYLVEPGDRPAVAVQRVGVAIVETLRGMAGQKNECDLAGGAPLIGLKWPNDVLLDGRKLAGILAQRSTAVRGLVIGFGVNVAWAPPGAAQVSEILDCRPGELLAAVLATFDALPADHAAFTEMYRRHLLTLGQRVRVHLPGDVIVDGVATDVDSDGRIIVRTDDGNEQVFDVGDVIHLRPESGPDGPVL